MTAALLERPIQLSLAEARRVLWQASAPEAHIAAEIVQAVSRGVEVVLHADGAVQAGAQQLGLGGRFLRRDERQAALAVGLPTLVRRWQDVFAPYAMQVAPLVFTTGAGSRLALERREAVQALLRLHVVPMVVGGGEAQLIARDLLLETIVVEGRAAAFDVAALRRQWLLDLPVSAGRLMIDEGGANSLARGKSLSPAAVTEVIGEFTMGAMVRVLTPDGKEVARGLVAYASSEARQIIGRQGGEIEALLGEAAGRDVLIHRDDLVLA